MKTVDDIERLRSAEKEAQVIVAAARQGAQEMRRETEARVAELTQRTNDELAAMRESGQSDSRREAETLRAESHERVEAACRDVAQQLDAGKAEAIRTVVEELSRP